MWCVVTPSYHHPAPIIHVVADSFYDIDDGQTLTSKHIKDEEFREVKRIVFDSDDNYVAVLSDTHILVYSLDENSLFRAFPV